MLAQLQVLNQYFDKENNDIQKWFLRILIERFKLQAILQVSDFSWEVKCVKGRGVVGRLII